MILWFWLKTSSILQSNRSTSSFWNTSIYWVCLVSHTRLITMEFSSKPSCFKKWHQSASFTKELGAEQVSWSLIFVLRFSGWRHSWNLQPIRDFLCQFPFKPSTTRSPTCWTESQKQNPGLSAFSFPKRNIWKDSAGVSTPWTTAVTSSVFPFLPVINQGSEGQLWLFNGSHSLFLHPRASHSGD